MDIMMKVDTALSEVPVNYLPLVDDTDGKTRETSIAYNEAGMDLVWNFVDTSGNFTQTAVTPTTGGTYDWTNQGKGQYTIEIPASGGASINNDTEGHGWFSGICTGVRAWTGPIIRFVPANIVDSLVNGSDYLKTDIVQQVGADIFNYDFTLAAYSTGLITLPSLYADGLTTLPNDGRYQHCIIEVTLGTGEKTFIRTTTSTGVSRQYNIETPTVALDATSKCTLVAFLNTLYRTDVVNWKGSTAPAMTGDAFARLGAPAGASIAADIAGVRTISNKLDTAMELDSAVYRFTTNALEQAPSGGGGGDASWSEELPGSFTGNQAGAVLWGLRSSGRITLTAPTIDSTGAFTVVRGADYYDVDGQALSYTLESAVPDLTDATVTMYIQTAGEPIEIDAELTGEGTSAQIMEFDITSAHTSLLTGATHDYDIWATLDNGHEIPLKQGVITVRSTAVN